MTLNYLRCGFLTIVLGFVVSMPARAQTPSLLGPCTSNCKPIGGVTTGEIVGVVVGVAAAVTIVTILVIHKSHEKKTITGCVNSANSGMTITDEKDKRAYALSGNTAGIKPGDRVKLQGEKVKTADKTFVWQTENMTKDFGACPPQQ